MFGGNLWWSLLLFFWLKSVSPTFANQQKNVLNHWLKLTCEFFKIIENKQKLILFNASHCSPSLGLNEPYLILVHLPPCSILFGPTRLLIFGNKFPVCLKWSLKPFPSLHNYLTLTNFPHYTFIWPWTFLRQVRVMWKSV